jgi:uncharacterized membrane protein
VDWIAITLAVCVVTLLAGFALKGRCLGAWDGRQYEGLCYNDLQPLYLGRSIDRSVFPYVHGSLQDGQLVEGAIEYPVLTGVFMWASGLAANDSNEYLIHSALLLAPFGLFAAYLLARMHSRRALLFAAAPAVVLYAFHNWDLLVVAAATAGFWAWYRERPLWAGAAFALGGALKAYPLFFLVPLVLERWLADDRRGALHAAGAGAGVTAAINLPFIALNSEGWWAMFEFHRARTPNWDNMWTWLSGADIGRLQMPHLGPDEVNTITTVLIGGAFAIAVGYGFLRGRREGAFPGVQVAGAMLAAFLLFNKVHSPQFTLWLLPFFVMIAVNVWWWVAYAIADLSVYVGVFRWFHDFGITGSVEQSTWAKELMIAGVWGRAGLLAVLFFLFLFARRAPSPLFASHPSASVSPEDELEIQASPRSTA